MKSGQVSDDPRCASFNTDMDVTYFWNTDVKGQIQKLLQCCPEPYQKIPLVITIQKNYSLT